MTARPGTGGAPLAIVATAALLAIAAATNIGSCRPTSTPTPSERPLQTGRMPASPP